MQIKKIELTALGSSKFNKWISVFGVSSLNLQAVAFEALNSFEDDLNAGETPHYELGQQFTKTGRPEVFNLESEDYTVESCDEE